MNPAIFFNYLGGLMTPRFFCYLLLLLTTGIVGLSFWKKLDKKYRVLTVFVFTAFLSESLSRVFIANIGTGHPTYHVFIPLQCLFYWYLFRMKSDQKRILDILYILFFVLIIFSSIFIQNVFTFPSNSVVCISFATIISVLIDFERMRKYPAQLKLVNTPDFWFNIGTLSFFTLTFFSFGLMNVGLDVLPFWIYDLIFSMNIFLYLSYLIAIIMNRRQHYETID